VLRIRIRDPVLFDPWIQDLDPGSGMEEIQRQDPGRRSKFFDPDPGSCQPYILDPGWKKSDPGLSLHCSVGFDLLRCRLWELVERKEESRTPVSLDQLDLDPRTGETAAHSGQVLSLTTPAGNKVTSFLFRGSGTMKLGPIRLWIQLLYKAK
jgi:hypothetical protein